MQASLYEPKTHLTIAPEVINSGQVSQEKIDVWQMGCLLFRLVTGINPFFGTDINELKLSLLGGFYCIPK